MRLVTYNIQLGKGCDGRFDLRRIADAVRDADVIALQEVGRHWLRSGITDQPLELAVLLPDHHCSTPLLPRLSACWIDDGAAGSVWTDLDL